MSESYDKLTGAKGRQRFFRPTRLEASAIFHGEAPTVWFNDRKFKLNDISVTGIGASTKSDEASNVSNKLGGKGILRLTQRGEEIFSGSVRAARTEAGHRSFIVGFALEDGSSFDIPGLVKSNAKILVADSREKPELDISDAYKGFCADVLSFIGGYLSQIERHIGPVVDSLSLEERNDIAVSLAALAKAEWLELLRRGNELVIPIHRDKALRSQYKLFTESVVTRELAAGESWSRCYHKPMGYPGDYQIMNYMYDDQPLGSTLQAQFLHKLGTVAGTPIVSRMERLSELVVEAGHRTSQDDKIRIMSIGSGPARELENIVKMSDAETAWHATLVDQEALALEYAVANMATISEPSRLSVSALNMSFLEMLNGSAYSMDLATQDVIYSAGLVDYLSPLLSLRFVSAMYDRLKSGGRLIIGNVNDLRTGTLWPMEYILDWTLYFRSKEEMFAMSAQLEESARIKVVEDRLNAIYLLVIDKPL